jgi:hypothetical protein
MVVAIEDAGFEIRDQIMWLYGSGFPKSHDVSKAIDKCNAEPDRLHKFTAWMRTTGLTARQIDQITGTNMGSHYLTAASQPAIPTPALWSMLRPYCGFIPDWVDELIKRIEAEREVVDQRTMIDTTKARLGFAGAVHSETYQGEKRLVDITAPATPEAARWQGWGTALKPAHEPICVARKPLRGTVAANVLAYGTGAINVDGCRVGETVETWPKTRSYAPGQIQPGGKGSTQNTGDAPSGRWPANVIHDGSEEVVGMFPNVKGQIGMQTIVGGFRFIEGDTTTSRRFITGIHDSGSAARFFYSAKASKADRDEGMEGWEAQAVHRYGAGLGEGHDPNAPAINRNIHPTVKPTDLMRYLVRLVTPPGGLVLDPFTGSGSTGKAAVLEGMRFIGCELSPEYAAIAEARIKAAAVKTGQVFEIPASPAPGRKADGEQLRLFA